MVGKMSFMMLAELCDKGSSSLAQKDLLFDSGIYPVYGAAGEITKVDFFHQSKPYLGLIKDGAGVGRVMKLPANSSVIGTIQYLFPRENVDLKYLYYLIKYLDLGKSNTGATIPHIYFKDYKKRKVKVREYSEQKHIGQTLELIDSHLSTYKNILDQYDLLIKSRFVEMFGDLNHNPLYPVVNLKNLIIGSPLNGFFASKELYDKNGKVKLVGVKEVVGHLYTNICDTSKLDVDDSTLEKYLIDYGDLLFCRSSLVQSGIAKASIVPKLNNKSCIFECHIIKLKLDQQLCIPEFMQVQSEQTYFRNQVIKNSKTATMTTISQQGIVDTKVLLPPLAIQQEFTKFLSQINKLKSDVQKSINETQLLMDSLMQEYFG